MVSESVALWSVFSSLFGRKLLWLESIPVIMGKTKSIMLKTRDLLGNTRLAIEPKRNHQASLSLNALWGTGQRTEIMWQINALVSPSRPPPGILVILKTAWALMQILCLPRHGYLRTWWHWWHYQVPSPNFHYNAQNINLLHNFLLLKSPALCSAMMLLLSSKT